MKSMRAALGFTLLELMVTVLIIALLAALALPSYQTYVRRAARSEAQSAMLSLSEQLMRHRARYLSYVNFSPQMGYVYVDSSSKDVYLPVNSTSLNYKYKLTMVDLSDRSTSLTSATALGQGWFMLAAPNPTNKVLSVNEYLLLSSQGLRCMTKSALLITAVDCGASSEIWK
jgi:type IV pilus assembly protein PilE